METADKLPIRLLYPTLSAVTSALLLTGVGLRMAADIPLFATAGQITDPTVAALITLEAAPLAAAFLLGLAAGVLGWLAWTGRFPSSRAPVIVFGLILLGSTLLAGRGEGPAQGLGWALLVVSTITLIASFRVHKGYGPPRPNAG